MLLASIQGGYTVTAKEELLMAGSAGFGFWVKVERQAREWTQAQMAAVVGVSTNTIARWERGEVTPTPLAQGGVRTALANYDRRKGKP
jgi:DNA-binding transcriptional regulator YiaG